MLDLRAIRAEEDKILNSYGWVDQPKGVVRIPVAQAIDILATRGLPAHTAPPADQRGQHAKRERLGQSAAARGCWLCACQICVLCVSALQSVSAAFAQPGQLLAPRSNPACRTPI